MLAPGKSVAVGVEAQREMVGEIKGARLEVVDVEGHEIYVTGAEKCQGVFLEFLEGLPREA